MKTIIENIKSNRDELVSKYFDMKKEIKKLSKGIQQAKEMGIDMLCYKLSDKRYELTIEMSSLQVAINNLGNALNHLGKSTETFWGEE